ncbi:MAG: SusD/RagB family nutrient-binding outer membrane lipoprotein [Bacteroidota bacterium]
MKRLFHILPKLVLGVFIITSSCTKDFDEINRDPNNPENAPNLSVLSYSIVELGDRFNIDEELSFAASYVGHIAMGQNNDANKYLTQPPEGMWASYYVRSLHNLNNIISTADPAKEVNIKAAALVLKAYATMIQVDAYGEVPYFNAAKLNEGVTNAAFDSERDIYLDLFELLKEANELFTDEGFSNGDKEMFRRYDILFGTKEFSDGIMAWKKFANSLRLRLAIRASNVDFALAATQINEILSDPATYPIIDSNEENAALLYPGTDNWIEPWTDYSGYYPYIYMAAPLIDTMNLLTDPRRPVYAKSIRGRYRGLQVGADGSASKIQPKFINNITDGKVFFLTYSEVEFLKAEAYSRGLVTKDAAAAKVSYEQGIRAHMEYMEVEDASIDSYILDPMVVWNGDEAGIQKLYIQKWISLFRQSWEAWAEMRRTDVPLLSVAEGSPYGGHNRVPFRFGYPDGEIQKNSEQPSANVVDFYWGDQIWWDTRSDVQ